MRTKMQVDTFIFLLLYCLFGVYAMRFIYMFIVKSIESTRVIHVTHFYHHIEHDIHNFCVS